MGAVTGVRPIAYGQKTRPTDSYPAGGRTLAWLQVWRSVGSFGRMMRNGWRASLGRAKFFDNRIGERLRRAGYGARRKGPMAGFGPAMPRCGSNT
jgi:hypothetical protein